LDLSVEPWDPDAVDWAQAVGFSVPMHTAMRLAMNAARRVAQRAPRLAICFYGLYAPVSQELVVGELAGRAIAGEYEPALVAWANGLADPALPSRLQSSVSSTFNAGTLICRRASCCRRSNVTPDWR